MHLVWIPNYRKAVLTGEVAVRVRDLLRQIAAEHEAADRVREGCTRPRTPVCVVSAQPGVPAATLRKIAVAYFTQDRPWVNRR